MGLSEPLPLPSDVITPSSRQNNLLYGISCDPTGELCSAIGSYKNSNTSTVPLSYTSTNQGRSWTLSQVPLPVPTDAPSQNQQKVCYRLFLVIAEGIVLRLGIIIIPVQGLLH